MKKKEKEEEGNLVLPDINNYYKALIDKNSLVPGKEKQVKKKKEQIIMPRKRSKYT